jgi:hypothetical protein
MDLDEFLKNHVLYSPQHRCFYHFTDRRNLPSIREHGMLSMQRLRAANIQVPAPGGNQWSQDADLMVGMDRYVHLCFTRNHPMAYLAQNDGRIQNAIYLQIKPEVIKNIGTMITLGVSNKAGIQPGPASAMLDRLDLEVLYKRTNWKDASVRQRLTDAEKCELLIPDHIPANVIMNLGNG